MMLLRKQNHGMHSLPSQCICAPSWERGKESNQYKGSKGGAPSSDGEDLGAHRYISTTAWTKEDTSRLQNKTP